MTAWASFGQQETAEYQGTGGTISFVRRFLFGPGIAEASYGYDVFQQPPVGSGAASSQQRGPKGAHGSLPRFTDAPGIDQSLVSINAADARTYQFQDALGSVILATNAAGQITEKYGYTAYGVTLYAGANTAAYRYTGRRYDAETGLYFYRNRAYSPALGRFLQTDPLGTDGGINLYAYVGNDPIDDLDPTGLASINAGQNAASAQGVQQMANSGYYFTGPKITNSLASALGMSLGELGAAIHSIKDSAGLGGADNITIHVPSGDAFFNGEYIGNVKDE